MTADHIEEQLETFCKEICVHFNPDPLYTCEACIRCDVKTFVAWVTGDLHD